MGKEVLSYAKYFHCSCHAKPLYLLIYFVFDLRRIIKWRIVWFAVVIHLSEVYPNLSTHTIAPIGYLLYKSKQTDRPKAPLRVLSRHTSLIKAQWTGGSCFGVQRKILRLRLHLICSLASTVDLSGVNKHHKREISDLTYQVSENKKEKKERKRKEYSCEKNPSPYFPLLSFLYKASAVYVPRRWPRLRKAPKKIFRSFGMFLGPYISGVMKNTWRRFRQLSEPLLRAEQFSGFWETHTPF